MAYVRQLKSGSWRAEVSKYGDRVSKVHPSKEEAEKWAAYYETTLDRSVSLMKMRANIIVDVERPILLSAIPNRVLEAIGRAPYGHHEVVVSSYKFGSGVGIYFLLMEGEVVYVGQTTNFLARLHKHQRDGKAFDAFSFMQCRPEDLDELEATYIDAFLPVYNRTTGAPIRKVGQ